MSLHGERETGAAKRLRERRLRSWFKHERQTVRMVLARDLPPLLSTVSAEVQGGVCWKARSSTPPYGDRRRQGPRWPRTSRRARWWPGGRSSSALKKSRAGGLPASLSEVAGRQEKVVRHVMEDLGSVCPFVQILDLPVPQTVDYVVDSLRFLDFPVAEQVIHVPRISCSPCPSRSRVPEPQTGGTVGGSADRVCLPPGL